MHASARPAVSVVMGCLNGAAFVTDSVNQLRKFLESTGRPWEIVIVEDGSKDGTAAILERLASRVPELRLLQNDKNRGKGFSVRRGVMASQGDVIVFTDADLAYSTGDLAAIIHEVEVGHPVVIANRRLADSRSTATEAVIGYIRRRTALSEVFNFAVRQLFGLNYVDTQAGLKGFSRSAGHELFPRTRTDRFLFDIEILLLAMRSNIPVKEIPVSLNYLTTDSTLQLRHGWPVLYDLLRIKLMDLVGWYNSRGPAK